MITVDETSQVQIPNIWASTSFPLFSTVSFSLFFVKTISFSLMSLCFLSKKNVYKDKNIKMD